MRSFFAFQARFIWYSECGENISRRLPWTPKESIHFLRRKSSGVTYNIIVSGLVSFPVSLLRCIGGWVRSEGRVLRKCCFRLPFPCANPRVTTTWFVWNAGIGGKPYAATLAPDT